MTTEDSAESGIVEATEGQPTPEVEQQDASADLGNAERLQSMFEAISKRLDGLEKQQRVAQGDKDRGVKKVEKTLSQLVEEWEAAKAKGTSVEDFTFREEVRNFMARFEQPSSFGEATVGAVKPDEVDVVARAIIEKTGLTLDDPDVVNVVQNNLNPSDLAGELAALAIRKATPKPTPKPTQIPPQSGGGGSGVTADELLTQISDAQHRGDMVRLAALEKKARETGIYK